MSKTYILQPTEMSFVQDEGSLMVYFNEPLSSIAINTSWDDLQALVPIGTIIDIDGVNKFIVAQYEDGGSDRDRHMWSTESGNPPTDEDINVVEINPSYQTHGTVASGKMYIYGDAVTGSEHTVSIYTESEDSDDSDGFKPITREEMYLAAIAGIYELPSGITPITRKEILYQKILDKDNSDSSSELPK